jgi:hypothetical protein
MRQWMCDPRILCRKHLLGEHLECHMFLNCLVTKKKIKGYLDNNLFEPRSLWKRHNELVEEMKSRGYKHKTVLECTIDLDCLPENKINKENSLAVLVSRCKECRKRMEELNEKTSNNSSTTPR